MPCENERNGYKLKKFVKSSLLLLLVAALSISLTGCGSKDAQTQPADKKYTIKVASYFATAHPQIVALNETFKKYVETESKGRVKVEIFDNSQLGGEEQFIDAVKNGTIEMAITGLLIAKDEPILGVLELPFIFESYDHAKKVLDSQIGQDLSKNFIPKMGFRNLGWTANGFRVVSSTKPIEKFEDFNGFRLRVPNADRFIKMAQGLGANPLPLPMPEVFTALEQKIIDGQENPYATLKSSGWWEAQKYVVDTRHIFGPNLYIMNEKFYQSLGPELQKIIDEGAKRATEQEWKLLEASEIEDIKFLEKNGLKVTYPDAEFKEKLVKSQVAVHEWFFGMVPGSKELVEKIKATK